MGVVMVPLLLTLNTFSTDFKSLIHSMFLRITLNMVLPAGKGFLNPFTEAYLGPY